MQEKWLIWHLTVTNELTHNLRWQSLEQGRHQTIDFMISRRFRETERVEMGLWDVLYFLYIFLNKKLLKVRSYPFVRWSFSQSLSIVIIIIKIIYINWLKKLNDLAIWPSNPRTCGYLMTIIMTIICKEYLMKLFISH